MVLSNTAIEMKDLSIGYETDYGVFWAVKNISISISVGTSLCIVGESGSGKSTLGNAIAGLLPPYSISKGVLKIFDKIVICNEKTYYRDIHGKIVVRIPQNPLSSLNPFITINEVFLDAIKARYRNIKEGEAREIIHSSLDYVELSKEVLNRYPHQLSGGMAQRVIIALAIALNPKIIVADEPTSSLDAYLRGLIASLISRTVKEKNITLVMITHDILLASRVCDKIGVMYKGYLVEIGETMELIEKPYHPYTQELIEASTLSKRDRTPSSIKSIGREISDTGCVYSERCPYVFSRCNIHPEVRYVSNNRGVACWKIFLGK